MNDGIIDRTLFPDTQRSFRGIREKNARYLESGLEHFFWTPTRGEVIVKRFGFSIPPPWMPRLYRTQRANPLRLPYRPSDATRNISTTIPTRRVESIEYLTEAGRRVSPCWTTASRGLQSPQNYLDDDLLDFRSCWISGIKAGPPTSATCKERYRGLKTQSPKKLNIPFLETDVHL